jgi:hypothetical protein
MALTAGSVLMAMAMAAHAACDPLAPNPYSNPSGGTITNTSPNGCNEGVFNNAGQLINAGSLTGTAGLINNNGVLNNSGLISGGPLSVFNNKGIMHNAFSGQVKLDAQAVFNNNGVLNNRGSIVNADPFAPLNNNAGGVVNNFGSTQGIWRNHGIFNNHASGMLGGNDASIVNYAGAVLNNQGQVRWFRNEGLTNNSGSMGDYWGGASKNSGTLNNNDGGVVVRVNNSGTFVNSAGSYVKHQVINTGQFVNAGTINSDQFYNLGFTQAAGQTINNGAIAMDVTIDGGTFKGSGSVNGALTVNGGTLAPGDPKGAMTLNGDLTFNNGRLLTTIGGTAPGQFSVLNINGAASFLGGTFGFSFVDGYVPHAGDHWLFLTATGGISGWDNLLATAFYGLPGSFSFSMAGTDQGLMLTVAAVPEPEVYAMLGVGLAMTGFVARRRKQQAAKAAREGEAPVAA